MQSVSPNQFTTAISADCTVAASALPANATRVYIALRNGHDGSGKSADDARDGSLVETFDTILRCYSEGCGGPGTENLIVCLGPGTFQTRGNYDAHVDSPHLTPYGFTLAKGWKLHGQGAAFTALQLSAYLPAGVANPQPLPSGTGAGVVLSTSSHNVSGIEISDLTIDANYPVLKAQATQDGLFALNLEAIHLWSGQGHNWVHNVNIINTAGEIGVFSEQFEVFSLMLNSSMPNSKPSDSSGNIIENVNISAFGGGAGTAIAIGNSVAEVRNNIVDGYQIGYGGWMLGQVRFHDNIAKNTVYGFNIDAPDADGASIVSNTITARIYGMVIGGGASYKNLTISDNNISLKTATAVGILFQGDVTSSVVRGNSIVGEPSAAGAMAILNTSNPPGAAANAGNVYQSNHIDSKLKIVFAAPSVRTLNCAFGNQDELGHPRGDLPDTTSLPCIP